MADASQMEEMLQRLLTRLDFLEFNVVKKSRDDISDLKTKVKYEDTTRRLDEPYNRLNQGDSNISNNLKQYEAEMIHLRARLGTAEQHAMT